MRIAFYAAIKSPFHPVPSGDRLMARLLIAALERAGHEVEVVSEFRSLASTPEAAVAIAASAQAELASIRQRMADLKTDLWFSYHTYYKSPDLFGPAVAAEFGIPYITAEASYSRRRDGTPWEASQALVAAGVRQAAVNICMTERDLRGLSAGIPQARCERLLPFIDTVGFEETSSHPPSGRLVTVAMMRSGDKLDSYRMLAQALALIEATPWTLTVIGDGPKRDEVQAMFRDIDERRIEWLGEKDPADIAGLLAKGGIYVWPGCGEAYGLAYLEAQAAGLPVIAQSTAGVPEVVRGGETGYLTPEGDIGAYAAAISGLLADNGKRQATGCAARRFVLEERSLTVASRRLDAILRDYLGPRT